MVVYSAFSYGWLPDGSFAAIKPEPAARSRSSGSTTCSAPPTCSAPATSISSAPRQGEALLRIRASWASSTPAFVDPLAGNVPVVAVLRETLSAKWD